MSLARELVNPDAETPDVQAQIAELSQRKATAQTRRGQESQVSASKLAKNKRLPATMITPGGKIEVSKKAGGKRGGKKKKASEAAKEKAMDRIEQLNVKVKQIEDRKVSCGGGEMGGRWERLGEEAKGEEQRAMSSRSVAADGEGWKERLERNLGGEVLSPHVHAFRGWPRREATCAQLTRTDFHQLTSGQAPARQDRLGVGMYGCLDSCSARLIRTTPPPPPLRLPRMARTADACAWTREKEYRSALYVFLRITVPSMIPVKWISAVQSPCGYGPGVGPVHRM